MSSFFSFGKPGTSAIKPVAPTIRKEIRTVSKPKTPLPVAKKPLSTDRLIPQKSRTTSTDQPVKRALKRKADNSRVTAVRAATKRKSSSPSVQLFDSSSDSDSSEGDVKDNARKKAKVGKESKPAFTRCIRDVNNWDAKDSGPLRFVHGADLTSGDYAKNFKPAFGDDQDVFEVVLQYPSPGQEERQVMNTSNTEPLTNSSQVPASIPDRIGRLQTDRRHTRDHHPHPHILPPTSGLGTTPLPIIWHPLPPYTSL